MSEYLVSKTDIDAIVSVARSWSETATFLTLPSAAQAAISFGGASRDEIGTALWRENWYAVCYGGDPAELSVEERAECDAVAASDGWERPAPYTFEELPGFPRPEVGLQVVDHYRYQSANDDWDYAPDHRVRDFVGALLELGRAMLEPADREGYQDLPAWRAMPWGLEQGDRDVFERLA